MASFTTSDGVRLEYTEEGDPLGRPVVLIAGFLASAKSWMFQQPALVGAGYRVLSLDTRGHGLSETPSYGFRMSRRGKDLEDFLVALDLHDALMIGGSMGGNTIWAHLSLFDTARIAAIVIVDQTPKMLNEGTWQHGFYGFDRSTMGSTFEFGVPDTGRGTPMMERGERLVRLVTALEIDLEDPAGHELTAGELALLNDHADSDWRDVIARVDVPVLFVAGDVSEFWPSSHAVEAAALNPLASAQIIPDCGHAANAEQPDAFNAIVLEFFAAQ